MTITYATTCSVQVSSGGKREQGALPQSPTPACDGFTGVLFVQERDRASQVHSSKPAGLQRREYTSENLPNSLPLKSSPATPSCIPIKLPSPDPDSWRAKAWKLAPLDWSELGGSTARACGTIRAVEVDDGAQARGLRQRRSPAETERELEVRRAAMRGFNESPAVLKLEMLMPEKSPRSPCASQGKRRMARSIKELHQL